MFEYSNSQQKEAGRAQYLDRISGYQQRKHHDEETQTTTRGV